MFKFFFGSDPFQNAINYGVLLALKTLQTLAPGLTHTLRDVANFAPTLDAKDHGVYIATILVYDF